MKRLLFVVLISLFVTACTNPKPLGGVEVGNGRTADEITTFYSPWGYEFTHHLNLEVKSTLSGKKTEVRFWDERAVTRSHVNLEVLEFKREQSVFDPAVSANENLDRLKLESARLFPNQSFSVNEYRGTTRLVASQPRDSAKESLVLFATPQWHLVILRAEFHPHEEGAQWLASIIDTIKVTDPLTLGALRLSVVSAETTTVVLSGHFSAYRAPMRTLRACAAFWVERSGKTQSPENECSVMSVNSQGQFMVRFVPKDVASRGLTKIFLKQISFSEGERDLFVGVNDIILNRFYARQGEDQVELESIDPSKLEATVVPRR